MRNNLSTEALARWASQRPKKIIGIWALVLVVALVLIAALLMNSLSVEFSSTNNPESTQASTLLEERLGQSEDGIAETVIVRSTTLTVDDSEYRDYVENLFSDLTALGGDVITGGINYYMIGDESMVSADRHTTLIPLMMPDEADNEVGQIHQVVDEANENISFEVFITGEATMTTDLIEVMEENMMTGELIGGTAAIIVLVLVFGAIIAALLPIALGTAAVVVALGATAIVAQVIEMPIDAMSIIIMLGLALGIDYSLFIVSRYREEREKGLEKVDAITATGATASRTVMFSGIIVILALFGMMLVPNTVFIGISIGAILVVIIAVLAALTLLPAILGLLGDKINRFHIPIIQRHKTQESSKTRGGFWDWTARTVMRRPVISLVITLGLLVAAAVPLFDIELAQSGVSTLPDGVKSKDGFVVLQEEFGFGQDLPTIVVIDGQVESEFMQEAIQQLETSMAFDPTFTHFDLQVYPEADLSVLYTRMSGDPWGKEAMDAIERLRVDYIPQAFDGVSVEVLVTGETAVMLDFSQATKAYTPIVFAFILGLSFLLLTLAFRSVILPIISIIMNLLSVGAAYGLLVLVFQKGVGIDLLGFQQTDTIETWIPLFLFCILFGLSMDYQVFLLSRIRERFLHCGNNNEAVAFGLHSTGRLITGAALIMVSVFGGFALGDIMMFQQMGFGLGVAVLLDATIIRLILVPATMRLLGKWNWFLPRWLNWLPRVGLGEDGYEQIKPVLTDRNKVV